MRYQLTARFFDDMGVTISVVPKTVEAKDPDGACEKAQPFFDQMSVEQNARHKVFMIRPVGRHDEAAA